MRNTEAIESDLGAAREAVRRLEEELREARLSDCPVRVGMIVRTNNGRRPDDRFLVTRLEPWGCGSAAVHGRRIKKDGTPGGQSMFINSSGSVQICEIEPNN